MAFSRGPKIVTDGLVLYLDAANPKSYPGTGNVWNDLSGNENNSTLVNGVGFDSDSNGSMVFDGTNDYAYQYNLPSVNLSTESYTIEIWFKLPNLPTDEIQRSGNNGTPIYGNAVGNNYMIFAYAAINNKSNLGVSYDDSRDNNNHRSNYELPPDTWVQFVHIGTPYFDGTYDRGKFTYYINGILDKPETISEDPNGYSIPTTFMIGRDTRWEDYGEVIISSIKRYDRALTAEEVKKNYNATKSRFGL